MWQRHNLRPEDYYAMPRQTQIFYIASEVVEGEWRDAAMKKAKKGR